MALVNQKFPLAGSERVILPGARAVGAVDASEKIKVSVYVRRNPAAGAIPSAEELGAKLPRDRQYLNERQILEIFGADEAELGAVAKFAKAHSLKILDQSAVKRRVLLEGSAKNVSEAFDTELKIYDHPAGKYRGRIGPIHVPLELAGIVEAVFGLDNRRVGRSYARRAALRQSSRAPLPGNTYFPSDIARLYDYPTQSDGSGQTIGIFAFNGQLGETGISAPGGYSPAVLKSYFENTLGLGKSPQIVDVVVHGPGNSPLPAGSPPNPQDVSEEIVLDLTVAGGIAPGAKIALYFSEFTEQGWVDAIHEAVTDSANNPSIISISYGNPEDDPEGLWTRSAIQQVNLALQIAAARGITVIVAAGDDGSSDGEQDHLAHVDFPASSPYVLAVGGTRVESIAGHISSETVWNDGPGSATGGGISRLFSLPSWQRGAGVPPSVNPGHRIGRGVPDASGLADPTTPVVIPTVDGKHLQGIGGTSATAPLWAGLIALINTQLPKPVGYFNPLLYRNFSSGVLRDIIEGDNGVYSAAEGWDAVSGLGSPDGLALLAALQGKPVEHDHAQPVGGRLRALESRSDQGNGNGNGHSHRQPAPADRTVHSRPRRTASLEERLSQIESKLEEERDERRNLVEAFSRLAKLLDRPEIRDEYRSEHPVGAR